MSVNLSPVAGAAAQFLDNSGNVLTGGKLYTYAAGTTTPQATYTSSTDTQFHTNPIILDAAGRVSNGGEIWLSDSVQYKFVLKDANDVLIGTWDNLVGINSNFLNFYTQEEIQTATAGQTVFTLNTLSYTPGTNSLQVFVDGVNQYDGISYAYVETDSTTVTFTAGLHAGALVKFTTAITVSAGSTTANLVIYDPPFTGSVPTTVENKLAQTVNVKDFGAVGDGVANDTIALQSAFAYCCSTHSTLYFPPGTYTTTTQLNVTSGFQIVGSDEGSNQVTATAPNYSCSILWTGSSVSTEYVIAVKATGSGEYVMGFGLTGLALRANNAAYGCLHLTNIRYCNLGTFWVSNGREYNILIDDNNGSIICGQSQINTIYNRHTTGLGIVLRSNGGSGLTQININCISGGNFEIGDCDSSLFGHIQVAQLIFRGTGSQGNPRASRKNRVLWFAAGNVFAEAGSKNIIDWVNNEGTSVTINSQASLAYSVFDRTNGMRYNTLNYLINDKHDLELNLGRAYLGSPVFGGVGTQSYNSLLFDDATQEKWQWVFRVPKQWREGKIISIDLLYYAPTSGNLCVTYEDAFRPLGSGINTADTTETFTIPCTANVTNFYNITPANPLEISGIPSTTGDSPELLVIRVGRNGTNAADTVVGDLAIFGVRLHWWGNATAVGTVYRYDPSPDVASLT